MSGLPDGISNGSSFSSTATNNASVTEAKYKEECSSVTRKARLKQQQQQEIIIESSLELELKEIKVNLERVRCVVGDSCNLTCDRCSSKFTSLSKLFQHLTIGKSQIKNENDNTSISSSHTNNTSNTATDIMTRKTVNVKGILKTSQNRNNGQDRRAAKKRVRFNDQRQYEPDPKPLIITIEEDSETDFLDVEDDDDPAEDKNLDPSSFTAESQSQRGINDIAHFPMDQDEEEPETEEEDNAGKVAAVKLNTVKTPLSPSNNENLTVQSNSNSDSNTGEVRIKCEVGGCNYTCKRTFSLLKHMSSQHNQPSETGGIVKTRKWSTRLRSRQKAERQRQNHHQPQSHEPSPAQSSTSSNKSEHDHEP